MNAIEEMANRLKRLQVQLPDAVGEMIAENGGVILDLQTEQLYAGKDSEGNDIQPPYSPFTVQIKRAKGQPTDRVTLKDEGDFYAGMFLSGGNRGQFAIGNRDQKTTKLTRKYGEEILGLNDNSLQRLIDDQIKPEIGGKALQVFNA